MKFRQLAVTAFLFAGTMLAIAGCDGGGGGSPGTTAAKSTVSLDPTLTAYLVQSAGAEPNLAGDTTLSGFMLVSPAPPDMPVLGFPWSITLDSADPLNTVVSNQTLVLVPDTYVFTLLISDQLQQYTGSATGAVLDGGELQLAMDIVPVIGETLTTADLNQETPTILFSYPEIASIADPSVTVIIDADGIDADGNAATPQSLTFAVNPVPPEDPLDPVTGEFGPWVSNLQPPGSNHTIRIELLSGVTLVGQGEAIITAGTSITLNLVPLHGEIEIVLSESAGTASFAFTFPQVVEDEAGAGDLIVSFSVVHEDPNANPTTITQTGQLSGADIVDNGDGTLTATVPVPLSGFQFGPVDITVSFVDGGDNITLGGCSGTVTLTSLNAGGADLSCTFDLVRRFSVSGSLLAVVGVNVVDGNSAPILGATVTIGSATGITGAGFGTDGYVKFTLLADTYTIRAEDATMFGEILNVTLAPLSVTNVEIVLDMLLAFSETRAATDRGWWSHNGVHVDSNNNTFTGSCLVGCFFQGSTPGEFRSFFTFDVSLLPGAATQAKLRLEIEAYDSPDPANVVSVWDVTTPAAILNADGSGRIDIFADLGTGIAYGAFTVVPTDVGFVLDIPLNAAAVADINASLGAFSVGLKLDTILIGVQDFIRFSFGSEPRVHLLVLTN